MSLRPKFNLLLFIVFAASFAAVAVVAERFLMKRMNEEVAQSAQVAIEALSAVVENSTDSADLARISRIKAVFQTLDYKFVATKSATSQALPAGLPDLMARFSASPMLRESFGQTGAGETQRFYLARPVRSADNKLERIQLVTIGMQFYVHDAERGLYALMGSLLSIFVVVFIILNILLDRMIVRPIIQVAQAADKISIGNLDLPQLVPESKDEIGKLVIAFNRMRRSTEEAIRLIVQ